MSIDGSLKTGGRLIRSRNVLKRVERIEKLTERDKFSGEEDSPFGLPKVRVFKASVGKKKKVKKEEGEDDKKGKKKK